MGWFNNQRGLFVVRLLPHIAWGFTTHHFDFLPRLCDLKTHGSRSTMNTWAQWTLWPSVKMENVGCLRLESVTEKHNQTATDAAEIYRKKRKQKWYFCLWPMDSIRISICYAESVNARFWPLSSWELTWRYDIQHAVLQQMCGVAQKRLANSWQIMAHHLLAGIFFGLFIHHLWTNFDQRDVFPKRTWNDYKPLNCVYQTYFQGKVSSKNMRWRGQVLVSQYWYPSRGNHHVMSMYNQSTQNTWNLGFAMKIPDFLGQVCWHLLMIRSPSAQSFLLGFSCD